VGEKEVDDDLGITKASMPGIEEPNTGRRHQEPLPKPESTTAHDLEAADEFETTAHNNMITGDDNDHVQDEPKPKKSFAFKMSILALLLMCLIVALDATILAIAIPIITADLEGTTLEAFWANISFILAVVVTQPIYTSVSDVIGRLPPVYVSFILFNAGAIMFALADNMTLLIAGRVIEGLGAGGLDVLNEVILADLTTLKERPLYLGVLAIPIAAGGVLGPVVGGLLAEHSSWRWIGWINLPLSAVNIALIFFFMKLSTSKESMLKRLGRLDWGGLMLFTAGCILVATPIAWAGAMYPWSSWRTIVPLCIGVVILVVFGWYEGKPKEAVFPHRIFKVKTSLASLIAGALHGLGTYVTIFYLPLYIQAVFQQKPLQSAVTIMPMLAFTVASGILGSVVVELTRKYKILILVSWVMSSVGAGIISLLEPDSSLAQRVGYQILLAVGQGTLFVVLILPIQASIKDVDDGGLAAGILVSFRLFGGLIGLAVCSTTFNSVFADRVAALGPLPEALAPVADAKEAVGFIPVLRLLQHETDEAIFSDVVGAYQDALQAVFYLVAGIGALGILSTFFIKELPLDREELGRQQLADTGTKTVSAN
jgi:MFS family permease